MSSDSASGWGLLRHRDYAFACVVRFAVALAMEINTVAIGWYIYDVTSNAFALGYLGLAGVIPAIVLALATGIVADRFDRRHVMFGSHVLLTLTALAMLWIVGTGSGLVWPVYIIVIFMSTARAFHAPANQAIIPALVPPESLASATAFVSGAQQTARILGPALGGLIYAVDARLPFATTAVLYVVAAACVLAIRMRAKPGAGKGPVTLEMLLAGFRFALQKPVVFGAVALDAAVVFLGGVVVLLPIFAKDILQVGPEGLGFLRTALALGALVMAAWLSNNNFVQRNAGPRLFVSIAVFGLAIVVFGLSTQPLAIDGGPVRRRRGGHGQRRDPPHDGTDRDAGCVARSRVRCELHVHLRVLRAEPIALRRDGWLVRCCTGGRNWRSRCLQSLLDLAAHVPRPAQSRSPRRAGSEEGMSSSGVERFDFLEHRDFLLTCVSRFTVTLAAQIQTVAVGWFIYDITGSALALGAVGLAAFLPAIALMLATGYVSDRFDRRLVLAACCLVMAVAALGQLGHVASGIVSTLPLYVTIMLHGAGRAFFLPASSALLPNLVPRESFAQAIALSTAVTQAANISGPAVGGLLYAISPNVAFGVPLAFYAVGALANYMIRHRSAPTTGKAAPLTLDHLLAGFRFMSGKPVILGALTLDVLRRRARRRGLAAADLRQGRTRCRPRGARRPALGAGRRCIADGRGAGAV